MSIFPSIFGRKPNRPASALEPVSVDTWDPFEAFSFTVATPGCYAGSRLDWKETPEAHVFIADLPGMRREEVKVAVEEEKVLKITGQRTKESEERDNKWHRVERSSDRFVRTVKLPPNAKVDSMRAVLENGVLTVTVPKDEQLPHGGRLIQISG